MKKIIPLFIIFLITVCTGNIFAQVTIGKLVAPDSSAVLQVIAPNYNKGVLVPALTQAQRDSIKHPADGLMVYTTDGGCFCYWSAPDSVWESVCGGLSKAVYTLDCANISVNGVYVQGTGLNGNNYLSLKVNVSKVGNFTVTATTDNGYGFSTQGILLNQGLQTILVPGQGQPLKTSPGDLLTINLSGAVSGCNNIKIPVLPPTATYTLSCGTAQFNGVYVKGKPLTTSNTVTFNVNVSDISTGGSWAVTSNTVNGIAFTGSGLFATTGAQMITLQGVGTPTSNDPITLTFTTNSGDGAATCTATVNVAIPPMTIMGVGDNGAGYDYTLVASSATANGRSMIMSQANFGTQPNSTVKFGDGSKTWTIDPRSGNMSGASLAAALNSSTPPDIVVIGYPWGPVVSGIADYAQGVQALVTYLKKGGVVLMNCEDPTVNAAMMNAVFNTSGITVPTNGGGAGTRYMFQGPANDPILNGPFGNLINTFWGEDASVTCNLQGNPDNLPITIYSVLSLAGAGTYNGNICAFRHNTLSFVWTGDGGFTSSNERTSLTICPFLVQAATQYTPVPKPNYGPGSGTYGQGPVYNSVFMANSLAWALNQALTSGINPH